MLMVLKTDDDDNDDNDDGDDNGDEEEEEPPWESHIAKKEGGSCSKRRWSWSEISSFNDLMIIWSIPYSSRLEYDDDHDDDDDNEYNDDHEYNYDHAQWHNDDNSTTCHTIALRFWHQPWWSVSLIKKFIRTRQQ